MPGDLSPSEGQCSPVLRGQPALFSRTCKRCGNVPEDMTIERQNYLSVIPLPTASLYDTILPVFHKNLQERI